MQDTRFVGALFSTEALDPVTRVFTAGPFMGSSAPPPPNAPAPLPFPRTGVECVEIAGSADVLIVGGLTPDQMGTPVANPESEVWNPFTNLMIGVLNMNTPRHDHGAVQLNPADNRILIVGGLDDQMVPIADVELWNR